MKFRNPHRVFCDLCVLSFCALFLWILTCGNIWQNVCPSSFLYTIMVNAISCILFVVDYRCSIRREYRVSESYLLIICFLGGYFGIFLGMIVLRHKWKKLSFVLLAISLAIVHILIIRSMRYQFLLW